MPYKSAAQRGYLHARHPEIAARWDAEIRGKKKRIKKSGTDLFEFETEDGRTLHDEHIVPGVREVYDPESGDHVEFHDGEGNTLTKRQAQTRIRKYKRDKAGKFSKMSAKDSGWLKAIAAGTAAGALANQFPRVQDVERNRRKKKGVVKKMLLPASADPDFNQEAAQRAFDLVMKMDDDTAEMFTHILVTELFTDDIEKNLGTLQRHLDDVISKQLDGLKKAHLRLVSKGMDNEQAVAYAQALALFSKAVEWESKEHPRGASGRFRTKVTHNQVKELHPKTAGTLGIAAVPEGLKGKDRPKFQDEYRQLADFLSSVNQSTGGHGNHEVTLHFQDRAGRQFTDRMTGTVPPTEHLANPDLTLIGAEAKPTTLTAGGAAFGLAGAMGANMSPSQVGVVNRVDQKGGAFADQWTSAGDDLHSNAKLYGRTKATGEFLSAVGPPGSKAQLAGKFAEIVGNAGPQAENVLGPTARKTAYRYRGTEKTPDRELVREYGVGIEQGKLQTEGEVPVGRMGARRVAAADRAPTWDERELGRRAVLTSLRETLPSQGLYALQLASGNTPPSEGVIINSNGQLATQAVGYADDHYLPFNLKNLKSLKGGEYIRTRSVGGLTAEDVYAGLVSGARQVTVTSRSGTFTMTFEDDFRGGRRHSDKARRMTRRYEQILDAVQSGQVERAQIPPEIKATIQRQVREQNPGEGNVTIRNIIKEREKEYREDPELSDVDEQAARHLALARFNDDNSPESKAFIRQRLNDLQRKKQVNWQLNGDGYEAALTALAEQFPYYIKTDSHVLDDEDKTSLEPDRGYVEPGRNRPTAARGVGLYGTKINPGLKREGLGASTASHADYQRGRFPTRSKEPEAEKTEEEKKAAEKDSPKKFAAQVAQDIKHRTAADALHEALFTGLEAKTVHADVGNAYPWLKDRDEYNRMMEGMEGPAAVDTLVAGLDTNLSAFPKGVQDAVKAWKISGTAIGDQKFVAGRWPTSPIPFPGPAYQKGAPLETQQAEFRRINSEYGRSLKFGGNIGSLNDQQLKQEHDSLVGVLRAIRQNPEVVQATNEQGAQTRRAIAATFYESAAPDTVEILMRRPEQIERKMLDLQQMRALKAIGSWPEGAEYQHTARTPEALNEAKPATPIFGDQGTDIVDAEVVEEREPVDERARAVMLREQNARLVRAAGARLAQKPESEWTENEHELKSALEDYAENPPTDSGELEAAHEHMYDLHRRSY